MLQRIVILNLVLTSISLGMLIFIMIAVILGYQILAQWHPLIAHAFDEMT